MPPKRPNPNVFGDPEDEDAFAPPSSDQARGSALPPKRSKIVEKPSFVTAITGATGPPSSTIPRTPASIPNNVQAQIEAARAKIQAQMSAIGMKAAAQKSPSQGSPSASLSAHSTSIPLANPPALPAKPAAVRPNAAPSTLSTSPIVPGARSSSLDDIAKQVAAAKERALKAMQSRGIQQSLQQAASPAARPSTSPPPSSQDSKPTGIHPLLMGGTTLKVQDHARSLAPKFSTLKANARASTSTTSKSSYGSGARAPPPQINPYLAGSLDTEDEAAGSEFKPKPRSMHKGFQFHKPGRHIREAEEARREAQMEELKRRIQESAKKAGLQDDLTGDEKHIKRQPPPDVEWWDAAFLPTQNYDEVPENLADLLSTDKGKQKSDGKEGGPLIYGKGSPIDIYVQHPIPIPAPSDKIVVKPRGVMLTKKEMKKLRKQRRAAELEDKQDRIKMGLLPPDPPKVKLSNLMKVLTSEAVADPTKVEARVRREVAARKMAHERANEERKLTDEQRREKREKKLEEVESRGVGCQVYKIKHLVSPSHKFKVRKNAQQLNLSGLTIFHPDFALVVVEGNHKALKQFKRLMMVRIDWTDPGRARSSGATAAAGEGQSDEEGYNGVDGSLKQAGGGGLTGGGQEEGEGEAEDVDLSDNKCELIFEGPLRERVCPGGFRARTCPTDHSAKETLGPRMEGYWDLAKRYATSMAD
ncbi:PRP3-domain-containing protein [Violaceomyces palustris]|uniref:PRP3-domain-containing protein n=1 Tax=Violaceomyces palustris TaxID=1673888 RepID=A0ACD0P399_9BASI|nr:PRP3-domain-containing protein [Violaceomyces palustris]